ncbi:interleukin-21 isoform X2 [Clupea harengus]|nr:interleukin-21 isoform X2 [Clupea harengus]
MPLRDLTMRQLYLDVKKLNKTIEHHGSLTLKNPGTDIKDCCITSALQCYRSQVDLLKVSSNALLCHKVQRSLRKPHIFEKLKGINISRQDCQKNQCQSCDSYPSTDSKEFMTKLISLLEMANSN